VGDVYGPKDRYVVVRKLGWGHFSTVWCVHCTLPCSRSLEEGADGASVPACPPSARLHSWTDEVADSLCPLFPALTGSLVTQREL